MLKLTPYEKEMLDGNHGRAKQVAMENIVRYANVLGAEELCEVKKAHLFCGAHDYLNAFKGDNRDIDALFSEMHLNSDEKIKMDPFACYCQADCAAMDPKRYDKMDIPKERGEWNQKLLDSYVDKGVNLASTCVPYMVGFIPMMGEHYVSSESHACTLMNSLWGACGNADGLEAGFWSAVCGRTPKWGMHDMNARKGTHLFEIDFEVKTNKDWDLLGYSIGRKLPTHSIPVLKGDKLYPDIFNIKYFFAAMATTSGPEMCHIIGKTPEAPTLEAAFGGKTDYPVIKITGDDLMESYNILGDKGEAKLDYISIGCPHYSIEELRHIANYLKGKKVAKGVLLNVWTALPIKEMSDRCGYTKTIEDTGALVMTSCCPLTSGFFPKDEGKNILFDSAKQAHYIRPMTKAGIYYRDLDQCLLAAVEGIIK